MGNPRWIYSIVWRQSEKSAKELQHYDQETWSFNECVTLSSHENAFEFTKCFTKSEKSAKKLQHYNQEAWLFNECVTLSSQDITLSRSINSDSSEDRKKFRFGIFVFSKLNEDRNMMANVLMNFGEL